MYSLKGDLQLDAEKYQKLFQISEKLHSTLDLDTLLGNFLLR